MDSRDPRIDPRPGDEIRQRPSNLHLRVTSITNGDPNPIAWEWRTKSRGWVHDNAWSLAGWRGVVAKGADILHVAPETEE